MQCAALHEQSVYEHGKQSWVALTVMTRRESVSHFDQLKLLALRTKRGESDVPQASSPAGLSSYAVRHLSAKKTHFKVIQEITE